MNIADSMCNMRSTTDNSINQPAEVKYEPEENPMLSKIEEKVQPVSSGRQSIPKAANSLTGNGNVAASIQLIDNINIIDEDDNEGSDSDEGPLSS